MPLRFEYVLHCSYLGNSSGPSIANQIKHKSHFHHLRKSQTLSVDQPVHYEHFQESNPSIREELESGQIHIKSSTLGTTLSFLPEESGERYVQKLKPSFHRFYI